MTRISTLPALAGTFTLSFFVFTEVIMFELGSSVYLLAEECLSCFLIFALLDFSFQLDEAGGEVSQCPISFSRALPCSFEVEF